jgi:hypothetical protein
MLELAMTPARYGEEPTVVDEHTEHFANLHRAIILRPFGLTRVAA